LFFHHDPEAELASNLVGLIEVIMVTDIGDDVSSTAPESWFYDDRVFYTVKYILSFLK
jgi:hypothetical protein